MNPSMASASMAPIMRRGPGRRQRPDGGADGQTRVHPRPPGRVLMPGNLGPPPRDYRLMATTLGVRERRRPLAALLAAEAISTTGSQMTLLALPWFVLVTTGSPARMGVVVAADLVPMVVLALPGGALAGRLGARRTMLACDLARAPLIGLVPLLHAIGLLSFPVLVGLVVLHGLFWPPYWASQGALLPELVGDDRELLTRASALFQAATRLTLLVGPALAGVLIGWLGPANVLIVDAATYLVAFALVAGFVPAGRGRAAAAADDLRGMLAGARVLLGDRLLRAWTVSASLSQMGFQTLLIALPVLAFTSYGQNPKVAGLLIGAWGGGALLGSLVALRLPSSLPPLTVGGVAGLGQALPLWLLVVPLPAAAAVAVLGVAGLANGIRVPPLRAVTLLRMPPSLRVQAMTAEATLPTAAGLLALALASPALETLGVTPVLAGVAAVATTAAVTFAAAAMGPEGRAGPAGS
jgi:MFS family permease